MCLAIPMQITKISGHVACAHTKGVEREVNLFMLQDDTLKPGDFVLVHVGYAIQKIAEEDARSAWKLHDAMLATEVTQGA